jgi:carbon-monoxide dehydrogenase medium subunit
MKPAPFSYHDPRTLEEAVDVLGRVENARLLAGGQSLLPMMNFRFATPDHIVDLNGIASLSFIRSTDHKLAIGAMTRQRNLEFSPEVAKACPILQEAILNVGHRQTRNRGTIGGSLCHLDPSAELVASMALLDAEIEIAGSSGRRQLAMEDFALGFMTTALEPDEVLAQITIPVWPMGHGWAFEEFARRHGDFAIASVAVLTSLDPSGALSRLAVVVSGLGPTPVRLRDHERTAIGEKPGAAVIEALSAAAQALESFSDAHVQADYRQHLAGVLCRRAAMRAFARAADERMGHG